MKASKVKKCKSCGKEFYPIILPNSSIKSNKCIQCLIEHQKQKEWKVKKQKLKEGLKTYAQKVQEARLIFQKYIRQRDKNHPCISCGTLKCQTWQGGHYLKAEIYSGLIFDEANCHRQCKKCNYFLDGNELDYRDGLIKRYGIEYVLLLENKKLTGRNKRWSDEELNDIKTKYKEYYNNIK